MGWMLPAAIIGSAFFSSESSSDAAQSAADTSRQASDASVAEQRRQYDLSRADQAPYLAAGTESVNRLANELRPGGRFAGTTPFSFNYADYKDPSLQFSLDENLRRMRRGRAAEGTYAGGGGIREEDRYLAGLMSTDMGNAFNRALTTFNANTGERNQLYNRLAGVAGTGQTATNQIGAQGANMAGNVGNILMGSATNQGNATMAAAGARNSAYGGAANMLGRMYGPQRGADPFGGGGGGGQMYGDPTLNYALQSNTPYGMI
jgi:hypothetical protein